METARKLAEIYHYDPQKAQYAGLLHDCAKSLSNEKKIRLCREYGLAISETELENPSLLHAKCGAICARKIYKITDSEILHAILVHTTGCPKMNLLDKIIYVADYIEPNRDQAPHLEEIRKIACQDLDRAVYEIAKDTIAYLKQQKSTMDETTLKVYEYYKTKLKKGETTLTEQSKEMAKLAYQALEEKKAEDIQIIDIRDISVIADYFVIASGSNVNQLQAMVDAAQEALYKSGYHCSQKEGNQNSSWILMDYKDIIIHLFSKEDRLFYDLERIWKDGKFISIEEL
ncbi:putative nicotinate-nucleotide adenylyltransferase [uncultured Roseburia sp.]|nr:putative nicotinate-nucleotide adenylyltransferase [uncultured Roseburia sp.]